ncbi:hypothetical protein KM295_10465 [Natronomonas sp. F2-12]|jgi:circadian clock protein KaiC|uniref:KaiC-like domain-containing protein n=1 Tax=Natronomonas aquatica TaxID=2841590 RepID=A0A9R1D664_9EURY|nr:hypothetical protein [Natronomonas aquatica]
MAFTGQAIPQLSTGIEGLYELLQGGLVKGRMCLVSGEPGTEKTTLGVHFLEEGLSDDQANARRRPASANLVR